MSCGFNAIQFWNVPAQDGAMLFCSVLKASCFCLFEKGSLYYVALAVLELAL